MLHGIVEFSCWIAVVALAAAFALALMNKWGWIEWLQLHAPSDLFNEMFSCKFCMSWWGCVIISLFLLSVTGELWFLAVPVCSTMITIRLW